jgi:hypothetical protein
VWTDSGIHQHATRTYEEGPATRLISIRDAMSTRNQDQSVLGLSPSALFLWPPASRQGYTSSRSKTGLCR